MKRLLLLLIFVSSNVLAKVGDFQFINQASNLNGEAFGFDYTKQNYYSLVEYGISKKTSIGGFLNVAKIDSNYNNTAQYALFGPEVFYRYKFYTGTKHGFTIHNSIKFPRL